MPHQTKGPAYTLITDTKPPVSSFQHGANLYEHCLQNQQAVLSDAPFLYTYGYEFTGLAYSVYLHQVIEKAKQFNIDHMIFVAREGYLFRKIYQVLQSGPLPMLSPAPSTHYACLSRRSTLLASTPQLTTREITLTTEKPGAQGLDSVLQSLGLPLNEFLPFARKHRIDLAQPITDYWNNTALLNFLGDVDMQNCVRQHHQKAYDNLQTYLGQCGFWGENRRVALVDIGWQGTIQDNLTRAFNHRADFPLLHGFYFGRREIQSFLRYSNSLSHGLIYDARNDNINLESIKLFVGLFEQAASAPHPSTTGYQQEKGPSGVVPTFVAHSHPSRQKEHSRAAPIALMQQGIVDFAHQYQRCWQQTHFSADTQISFLQGLITRHIAYPTYEEAIHLSEHLTNWMLEPDSDRKSRRSSKRLPVASTLILSKTRFWQSIKRGQFRRAAFLFQSAIWKPGSLRLLNIPGLASLYRIKRFLFPKT